MNSLNIRDVIDGAKFNRFHLSLLLWCTFIVTAEGFDLVVYGSVVPLLIKEWSLTPVQAGVIGSYGLFGMMIGSMIFGLMADKFGRKNIAILCVILFSVFTTASAFAVEPTFFSWCRLLAGLGIGGALPNAVALMTDYAPKSIKNTLIAIVLCGMQVGGVLAPFVVMVTIGQFGWHGVLWTAVIPLLFVPFMYKYMPESISHLLYKQKKNALFQVLSKIDSKVDLRNVNLTNSPEMTKQKAPIIKLFENNRGVSTVMFWIAYVMCLLMIYGLNTWLPNLMVKAGFELKAGLSLLITLNAAAVLGSFFMGKIADKWHAKKLLVILYLIGAVSLFLLGFKSNAVILYILVALAGACTMGTQNIANSFVSQYYPSTIRSTGLGLSNAVGRLGGIAGPTLGGFLLSLSLPTQLNFLSFAIPGFIAAIAFTFVRMRNTENEEAASKLEEIQKALN